MPPPEGFRGVLEEVKRKLDQFLSIREEIMIILLKGSEFSLIEINGLPDFFLTHHGSLQAVGLDIGYNIAFCILCLHLKQTDSKN